MLERWTSPQARVAKTISSVQPDRRALPFANASRRRKALLDANTIHLRLLRRRAPSSGDMDSSPGSFFRRSAGNHAGSGLSPHCLLAACDHWPLRFHCQRIPVGPTGVNGGCSNNPVSGGVSLKGQRSSIFTYRPCLTLLLIIQKT